MNNSMSAEDMRTNGDNREILGQGIAALRLVSLFSGTLSTSLVSVPPDREDTLDKAEVPD